MTHRRSCKMHRTSTKTFGSFSIKEKMYSVLNKNPGLNCIKLIRHIHCKINEVILQKELTP
jgi:hypothetical protein